MLFWVVGMRSEGDGLFRVKLEIGFIDGCGMFMTSLFVVRDLQALLIPLYSVLPDKVSTLPLFCGYVNEDIVNVTHLGQLLGLPMYNSSPALYG